MSHDHPIQRDREHEAVRRARSAHRELTAREQEIAYRDGWEALALYLKGGRDVARAEREQVGAQLAEIRTWVLRLRWADACLADEGIGPELGPLVALLGGDPDARITAAEIEQAFEQSLASMDPETAAEIRRGLDERPGHAASREMTP